MFLRNVKLSFSHIISHMISFSQEAVINKVKWLFWVWVLFFVFCGGFCCCFGFLFLGLFLFFFCYSVYHVWRAINSKYMVYRCPE